LNTWVNYHSHSFFCDGTEPPENYLKEAIRNQMPAYGFTAHAPVPFVTNWCLPDNRFTEYLQEINRLKEVYTSKIEVYRGLEIDFIPGLSGRDRHLNSQAELDYFIGSVHFVEKFNTGERWNIDTSFELFQRGLKEIFKNNIKKAVTSFWELSRQMIIEEKPDIVGHLDKIKMFNTTGRYFSEDEKWYREQVELTINEIKKRGCIIEINTRGYYRYNQPDLYPGEWIISRLIKEGIPIILSSDAHAPDEITKGMNYTAILLKKHGLKNLTALQNNEWQQFPFTDEGILIKKY
jgi:histidinol-phosphatase (PHP family)